jgi:hypothetical protein
LSGDHHGDRESFERELRESKQLSQGDIEKAPRQVFVVQVEEAIAEQERRKKVLGS